MLLDPVNHERSPVCTVVSTTVCVSKPCFCARGSEVTPVRRGVQKQEAAAAKKAKEEEGEGEMNGNGGGSVTATDEE